MDFYNSFSVFVSVAISIYILVSYFARYVLNYDMLLTKTPELMLIIGIIAWAINSSETYYDEVLVVLLSIAALIIIIPKFINGKN